MRKILIFFLLIGSLASQAQTKKIYGNSAFDVNTFSMTWLNTADSLVRIGTTGIRLFKPIYISGTTSASTPSKLITKQTDSTLSQISFTGSTTDFLRADGVFATPSGGGGSPGGSNTQVQYNSSGVFAGSSNFTWTNASNALGLGSSGTTAYLNLAAGTTSKALFNFGTGAAPTTPSAGDFWFDVADSSFKYRIGSNSLKWLFSKDQVVSTGLLLKPGAGTVADTIGVGGGIAGQVLVSNGSSSFATWSDLPSYAEGTYTASITNVTNVGTSSITTCHYQRRGDMVEVFGEITIDPTATGDTKLRISLPVASGITNSYELSGQATTFDNVQSVRIYHELGEAVFRLNASVDASSHVYSFRFIYKYIAP